MQKVQGANNGVKMIPMEEAEVLVSKSVDITMKRFQELLAAQNAKHSQKFGAKTAEGNARVMPVVLSSPSESTIYQQAVQPEQIAEEIIDERMETESNNVDPDISFKKQVNFNTSALMPMQFNSSSDEINTSDEMETQIELSPNFVGSKKQGGGDRENQPRRQPRSDDAVPGPSGYVPPHRLTAPNHNMELTPEQKAEKLIKEAEAARAKLIDTPGKQHDHLFLDDNGTNDRFEF